MQLQHYGSNGGYDVASLQYIDSMIKREEEWPPSSQAPSANNGLARGKAHCSQHPANMVNTLCHHLDCIAHHRQFLCRECWKEEPHCSHQEHITDIGPWAPRIRTFCRNDDQIYTETAPQHHRYLQRLRKIEEELHQLIISKFMAEMREIQCLHDLTKSNANEEICRHLQSNDPTTRNCALSVLNRLGQGEQLHQEPQALIISQERDRRRTMTMSWLEEVRKTLVTMKTSDEEKMGQALPLKPDFKFGEKELPGRQLRKIKPTPKVKSMSRCLKKASDPVIAFKKEEEGETRIRQFRKRVATKVPAGVTQVSGQTVSIWKADDSQKYQALFDFIRRKNGLRHIIIFDPRLATAKKIERLLNCAGSQLAGLYLHYPISWQPIKKVEPLSHLQYISFFQNFKWVEYYDLIQYFPRFVKEAKGRPPGHRVNPDSPSSLKNVECCSYHNTLIRIPSHVEDLLIYRREYLQQGKQLLFNISASGLLVLSLHGGFYSERMKLDQVFRDNQNIHTFVIDQAANFPYSLIQDLRVLPSLKHLKLYPHATCYVNNSKELTSNIFCLPTLNTLILNNFVLQDLLHSNQRQYRQALELIHDLESLQHLNLYGTEPVNSGFLKLLHPLCLQSMKVLNIGLSFVDDSATQTLTSMKNLEALCLDFINITATSLSEIMACLPKLQQLSLQGINDLQLSESLFSESVNKNLTYANIFGYQGLRNYEWEGYDHLECIRVAPGQLSKEVLGLLEAHGVVVFIDNEPSTLLIPPVSPVSNVTTLKPLSIYFGPSQVKAELKKELQHKNESNRKRSRPLQNESDEEYGTEQNCRKYQSQGDCLLKVPKSQAEAEWLSQAQKPTSAFPVFKSTAIRNKWEVQDLYFDDSIETRLT